MTRQCIPLFALTGLLLASTAPAAWGAPRPSPPATGVQIDGALIPLDPFEGGIGGLAVAPVQAPPAIPGGATSVVSAASAFRRSGYTFHPTAVTLPYFGPTLEPREDPAAHDSAGVRMVDIGGRLYDHPVAQAQYSISNLNTFRRTGDEFFLQRARANADRLIARRVVFSAAWFYPYPFDYRLHASTRGAVLSAPWYSGMAQGLALTAFARLYETTGLELYATGASATLTSMMRLPSAGPWVTQIDSGGYLWLQEYPVAPPSASDFTYNGHMFATIGLWDFWRVFPGSARVASAQLLFDGAVTTALHYAPVLRTANWISGYCLAHQVRVAPYHDLVRRLLLTLYTLTWDYHIARFSDAYLADYPPPTVTGTVHFAAGAHTAYTFSSTGAVVKSKALAFAAPSWATGDLRQRIQGRGLYYHLVNGTAAGYWVPEQWPRTWMTGIYAGSSYSPGRHATVGPGTVTGIRLGPSGEQLGSTKVTLTDPSSLHVSVRATVNSFSYLLASDGIYAGYWLPSSQVALS